MLSPNLRSLIFLNSRHYISGTRDDSEVKISMCVCKRERERLTLDSICDQQCALELVTIASNFNFDTIQIFLIFSICKIKIITAS